jgi:bifunctional non-homologous end joining protein LigD
VWTCARRTPRTERRSIAGAVAALPPKQEVFDGELVALDKTGRPSFTGLQERHRHIKSGDAYALAYYVFDLLELNGRSWQRQPLHARRRRLAGLTRGDTVLLSGPLPGTVEDIVRRVRQYGLEGVVAKRRGFTACAGNVRSRTCRTRCPTAGGIRGTSA